MVQRSKAAGSKDGVDRQIKRCSRRMRAGGGFVGRFHPALKEGGESRE